MAPYFSLLGFSRASLATICLKRLGPPSHPDLVTIECSVLQKLDEEHIKGSTVFTSPLFHLSSL